MRSLIQFLFFITLLLSQSCGKQPYPCFTTNPSEDNIHANQPISFSPYCSTNGKEFFWQFYANDDSIEFSPVVIKYFKDTGYVEVSLDVTNGNKFARVTDKIYVKP